MSDGEEALRTIVDRIGSATVAGDIVWRVIPHFKSSYTAVWHGWRLDAEWLQDEVYLRMSKDGKCITIPRLIMDCLHGVILDQLDPDRKKKQRRATREARKAATIRQRAEKKILEEILGLE